MLLPVVVAALGVVAERRVDAPLGLAGVAATRMDLGQHGHVDPGLLCLDGSAETGETPSDNDHVMMDHFHLTLPN